MLSKTLPLAATTPCAAIFPVIQSGVLGIREEERCLDSLFDLVEPRDLVDLTSGYFALYRPYQDRVLASKGDYRILAASPNVSSCNYFKIRILTVQQANGFLGSKGLSGRIPAGYTLLEKRFWERVMAAGRQWADGMGIQLSEWQRPGWTYHAKGLETMLSTPPTDTVVVLLGIWLARSVRQSPYATLFGSTNLNSRSAHLDTEISFVLSVPEHELSLRAALQRELTHIRKNAAPVDSGTFALPERQVSLSTKVIVGLVGSML